MKSTTFRAKKFLEKKRKKLEKSVDKPIAVWYDSNTAKNAVPSTASTGAQEGRKYGRFRDSEMTIVQIVKGIFEQAREARLGGP